VPILNHTTKVSATRTAAEIQSMLASKGAKRVTVDYDPQGDPVAVEFMIEIHKQSVWFKLPCNVDGVLKAMCRDGSRVVRKLQNRPQAQRAAWRIVKNWIEVQLALVEANQVEMAEVFLPYVIDRDGASMYARFKETQQKQLNAASA
jgi:hypothetical protein